TTYVLENKRLKTYIDPNNHRTTFSYAALPNRTASLQSITDAGGGRFSFLYDPANRVNGIINQLGASSTLQWDGNGNRTALIDAYNNRTTSLHNARGQFQTKINPLGLRATVIYNTTGLPTARIDPLSRRTSYTYNSNRQAQTRRDPLNRVSTWQFDPVNRVT